MSIYAETPPACDAANNFKFIADILEVWLAFGDWEGDPVGKQWVAAIQFACRWLQRRSKNARTQPNWH